MAGGKTLIYEVTLDVATDAAQDFEPWLRAHVREMLALPYFQDARILVPEEPQGGTQRWVVQYVAPSRAALDSYLQEQAPRMREKGVKRFGDKLNASRRVLEVGQALAGSTALPSLAFVSDAPRCRNCGTPLSAKFCPQCGQRSHTHVAPLTEIAEDFARQQFGFDAKFFHSIMPLLFRPGFLTREYCAGREERYVKPFRLYLFSSLLFFFLAAFMLPQRDQLFNVNDKNAQTTENVAQQKKGLQDALADLKKKPDSPGKTVAESVIRSRLADLDKAEPAPSSTTRTGASSKSTHDSKLTPEARKQSEQQIQQYMADLEKQPVDSQFKQLARAAIQEQLDQLTGKSTAGSSSKDANVDLSTGAMNFNIDDDGKQPSSDFGKRLVQQLKKIRENPEGFRRQLFTNLPKIMLLYLPIVALLLKLFYIGSKRYYVEHFVFTLHVHAMFFVLMLLYMLLNFSAEFVPWLSAVTNHGPAVIGWYVTIYLFLALRFFYGQGWFKTSFKFFLLFMSYWFAFALTIMADVALTAMEI